MFFVVKHPSWTKHNMVYSCLCGQKHAVKILTLGKTWLPSMVITFYSAHISKNTIRVLTQLGLNTVDTVVQMGSGCKPGLNWPWILGKMVSERPHTHTQLISFKGQKALNFRSLYSFPGSAAAVVLNINKLIEYPIYRGRTLCVTATPPPAARHNAEVTVLRGFLNGMGVY